MSSDQIAKQVFLKASKSRVWKALTDSKEFGAWFGMRLNGPFIAGQKITGVIAPTKADTQVAEMQKPYEGTPVEFLIDRMEPESLFSFKWHPYAIDPKVDYSNEPMTLITFTLTEKDGGVLLVITETGFDDIPIARRLEALKANEGGWAAQMQLISKYLALHAE